MNPAGPTVALRAVALEDLATFAGYRADPVAAAMAAVPLRTSAESDAQWQRILADPSVAARTITADGAVVGNLNLFGPPEKRDVGYWIDREQWGRGIASRALALFLAEIDERPLHAAVAEDNLGSQRVLEKCGFIRAGRELADDGIWEVAFVLRD